MCTSIFTIGISRWFGWFDTTSSPSSPFQELKSVSVVPPSHSSLNRPNLTKSHPMQGRKRGRNSNKYWPVFCVRHSYRLQLSQKTWGELHWTELKFSQDPSPLSANIARGLLATCHHHGRKERNKEGSGADSWRRQCRIHISLQEIPCSYYRCLLPAALLANTNFIARLAEHSFGNFHSHHEFQTTYPSLFQTFLRIVKEGLFLYEHGVPPYNGGVCHQVLILS